MIKINYNNFYKNLKILNLKTSCMTSTTFDNNINMNHCLFKDFPSIYKGGDISILSYSVNINDTSFLNCWSNGWGGALYFENNLNIDLFRNCAVGGKSAHAGQFAYFRTNSNQISKFIFWKFNISYNKNTWISGINYHYPNSRFGNYCTF